MYHYPPGYVYTALCSRYVILPHVICITHLDVCAVPASRCSTRRHGMQPEYSTSMVTCSWYSVGTPHYAEIPTVLCIYRDTASVQLAVLGTYRYMIACIGRYSTSRPSYVPTTECTMCSNRYLWYLLCVCVVYRLWCTTSCGTTWLHGILSWALHVLYYSSCATPTWIYISMLMGTWYGIHQTICSV